MATVGKVLLVAGLALGGLVFVVLARFGVTRLPGDVVVRRGSFTLYAPIGLMLLVSVILTFVVNVLLRR